MSNLKIEIKNYKKIKSLEEEFKSGNIYIISGNNNIGKTSLCQAIVDTAKGLSKDDILSHGEDNGLVKMTFIGADSKRYVIKQEFDRDKDKFTIIDPETKVLKSTNRNNVIADIFKYNAFTIEDWFGWGLTSEGRRKQADIILNLFPEDVRKEYLDIDSKVNDKNGTEYLQRRLLNKEYEPIKTVLDTLALTNEEKVMIGNKEAALIRKEKIEEDLSNVSDSSKIENRLSSIKKNLDDLRNKQEEVNSDYEAFVKENDERLDRLLKEIEEVKNTAINKKHRNTEQNDTMNEEKVSLEEDLKRCELLLETIDSDAEKGLKEKQLKCNDYLNTISLLEARQEQYNKHLDNAVDLTTRIDLLSESIKSYRERKTKLLEENKLPISNIVIEDGEALYITDGGEKVPFVRDSVSYSEGGVIILKLMAFINKELPIWVLGSAESYDAKRMAIFEEIVKEYDGFLFLDKVIDSEETELQIECYESK